MRGPDLPQHPSSLDMHHIWEVSAGGSNDPSNLIPLCPTCHALYHRGTYKQESIYVWKAMLVAITQAFDVRSIDTLLFLETLKKDFLIVSGDGALHFGRLVSAGLATIDQKANNNWLLVTYAVNISEKGRQLVHAWKDGNRTRVKELLGRPVLGSSESAS
jgi:HNH endonuclease